MEKSALTGHSTVPSINQNYRLIEKGDRWRCIRCGSCCHADFEKDWLDFIGFNNNIENIFGICSNLRFEDWNYKCSIYSTRPNACRAFPFTLKKMDDGRLMLVIHKGCRGYGKGKSIDIKSTILKCLKYSNKEFQEKFRLDFTSFDSDKSVGLVH